jgi:hypothetical protein
VKYNVVCTRYVEIEKPPLGVSSHRDSSVTAWDVKATGRVPIEPVAAIQNPFQKRIFQMDKLVELAPTVNNFPLAHQVTPKTRGLKVTVLMLIIRLRRIRRMRNDIMIDR